MGYVRGLDGDQVELATADIEELNRISEYLHAQMNDKTLWPGEQYWMQCELDEIEEEIEVRAREQDRQEMADDDERVGL